MGAVARLLPCLLDRAAFGRLKLWVRASARSCNLPLQTTQSYWGIAMRRRDFVFLFGSAAITPRAALAQATNRRPRVGYLEYTTKDYPLSEGYREQFLSGMRNLGYTDGQNFEMLHRFADFQPDREQQVAKELVELNPDVLVGGATMDAVILKKATDTIPIVIAALAAPVGRTPCALRARLRARNH
jgi:hypothetical protein